ncbi:hypothetical protein CK203_049828 [Vitis vinifera]|uniref:Uncharacterized protein n=1 Tax=Vitis vinifera TaxID=29760 RepID=A0A438GVT1_VITVI|nr:hypothetical protein CK203_049828 [Vitis vinifera]
MTTRGIQDPIAIHFLIDGQHGILEARDIAAAMHFPPIPEDLGSFRHWSQYSEPDMVSTLSGGRVTSRTILRRELPPRMLLINLVLRTNLFPLQHVVQRRGAILDALYLISEGFYFGPHHLVMAALTYFEEKVHRKRLRRAGTIPLLFPRLISQVLEDMGYPSQPHLERRHHCRELFTSESWTHFLDRSPIDQGILRPLAPAPPASPAPPDSPAASAPTVQTSPEQDPHTTEPSSLVPALVTCTTDTPTPPVTPAPAYVESSAGPSITISAIEFRALMSSFHSLRASQATLVREMQAIKRQMDSIQLFRLSIQLSWTNTPPCSLRSTITWAYHLLHLRSHIHDWIFLSPFSYEPIQACQLMEELLGRVKQGFWTFIGLISSGNTSTSNGNTILQGETIHLAK